MRPFLENSRLTDVARQIIAICLMGIHRHYYPALNACWLRVTPHIVFINIHLHNLGLVPLLPSVTTDSVPRKHTLLGFRWDVCFVYPWYNLGGRVVCVCDLMLTGHLLTELIIGNAGLRWRDELRIFHVWGSSNSPMLVSKNALLIWPSRLWMSRALVSLDK